MPTIDVNSCVGSSTVPLDSHPCVVEPCLHANEFALFLILAPKDLQLFWFEWTVIEGVSLFPDVSADVLGRGVELMLFHNRAVLTSLHQRHLMEAS